jgi:ABC-type transport system involved in multi-copper enzyme maturation permease subunit
MIGLFLRSRQRRILGLIAFAMLFLLSAAAARMLVGGTEHGQVEMGNLYMVGGYPLVSALLLLGWLIGRYALVAILVMMSGIVSADRRDGTMRLYAARPVSLSRLYLQRFGVAAGVAFVLSAILMPAFDFLLLARWGGPNTLVLITAYILVYGSLTFLLSVWTRGEVWIAMMLAIVAMLWDAVMRAGKLGNSIPGIREVVTMVLPPQSALFKIETAFGAETAMPWDSFAFVVVYSAILIGAALVSMRIREV